MKRHLRKSKPYEMIDFIRHHERIREQKHFGKMCDLSGDHTKMHDSHKETLFIIINSIVIAIILPVYNIHSFAQIRRQIE
jgi:hypothetical protein